jgi:DNA polymerase (family 10)
LSKVPADKQPPRLNIDWRFIDYCLEKNVLISITPNAHLIPEFDYIKYGIYAAQKGGVTKNKNVSSFNLEEFEAYIRILKRGKKMIHLLCKTDFQIAKFFVIS